MLRKKWSTSKPIYEGDAGARVLESLVATVCRHDQLGASVARVGDAVQVAEVLELVHQLRRGGEAQLRSGN